MLEHIARMGNKHFSGSVDPLRQMSGGADWFVTSAQLASQSYRSITEIISEN